MENQVSEEEVKCHFDRLLREVSEISTRKAMALEGKVLPVLAEEMNMSIVTCALNGGEDYELLFTCSLDDYEKLIPIDDLYLVGHITKPEYGTMLIGRNGEELSLQAQGWQAFKEN